MSTSLESDVLADQAGMQIMSHQYLKQDQSNCVQKGLSGWPPPQEMASIIMSVLGEREKIIVMH